MVSKARIHDNPEFRIGMVGRCRGSFRHIPTSVRWNTRNGGSWEPSSHASTSSTATVSSRLPQESLLPDEGRGPTAGFIERDASIPYAHIGPEEMSRALRAPSEVTHVMPASSDARGEQSHHRPAFSARHPRGSGCHHAPVLADVHQPMTRVAGEQQEPDVHHPDPDVLLALVTALRTRDLQHAPHASDIRTIRDDSHSVPGVGPMLATFCA